MKIGIIGGGISGLTIARLLQVHNEVLVFEKEKTPGGLIKCERVNDCLFHKVGGHVFNSKSEKISNWFWSHFNKETEFVKAKRNAKIFFSNKIIGYPIENYIYLFDKHLAKQIIAELLQLQLEPRLTPYEYDNFESFLKGNFGTTLYELYFKPYNQKIWQTDLGTVSMRWLEGKLPMPDLLEIFQKNIVRENEDDMVHSNFYYPKEGGSQFIIDRLQKGVDILCSRQVDSFEIKRKKIVIQDHEFDKIIYCGDLRQLPNYGKQLLKNAGLDVNYLEHLRSNGTSNLFCETDDNDISWMYIPEKFTKAHRIIYTGNFSVSNNRGSKRKTCVIEFSGKVSYDIMKDEVKKLPGDLTPLAHNYEANSYVIQDYRTRAEIDAAKATLKKSGIFLLGRFAEWEYYNMDKALEAAHLLYETEFKK